MIQRQRLPLVRISWILCLVLSAFTLILFIPYAYRFILTFGDKALSGSLAADGISPDIYAAGFAFAPAIVAIIFMAIGVLIFWRRSNEWNAIFTAMSLMTFGIAYAMFIHPAFTSLLPSFTGTHPQLLLVTLNFAVSLLGWTLITILLFIFPDGRFVPKWSIWLAVLGMVPTIAWRFPTESAISPAQWPPIVTTIGGTIVYGGAVGCQVYRYFYVSNSRQRQQTKWVLGGLALGIMFALVGASIKVSAADGLQNYKGSIIALMTQCSLVSLPISIAYAVLRHRLYDIDIIIRRTLIYSILSAILAVVFFGGVTLTQTLLRGVTGPTSDIAVVISTLGIAALFTPVRRRVQATIDRRFYRTKYDAQKTLEQFAMVMRDEVDPEKLKAALIGTIQETMQPTSIALWIRDPSRDTNTQQSDARTIS